MKLTFTSPLFHLLLYCATQALGIKIQSSNVSSDGVIQTELDKTVSLVCETDSPPDKVGELVWLRNDAAVSLKEGNRVNSSSICISPVTHDDNEATFTCHWGKNSTVKASVTLNVTFPPELTGKEDVIVEEEAQLILRCDIRANPPVSSVSWSVNGSTPELEAGGFRVTQDAFAAQLSASKAERSLHEATYQCTAISPIYGEHTKIFHVKLTEKTIKFPLYPMIAGLVVVGLTAILAFVSRWKKIMKCFRCLK